MSELGQDGRKLIERALAEERVASPRELSRIRRRVLAASRGVGILGGASQAAAWSGKTLVVATLKAALIGSAAAVAATGLFTQLQSRTRDAERPVSSAVAPAAAVPAVRSETSPKSPAPVSVEPVVGTAVAAQSPPGQATKPHRAATATASTAKESVAVSEPGATRADSLVSELSLLERVQAELRAGHGAEALSLLDHGDRELEFKQLGAERLAAEVMAACQAGQHARALTAGRRLMAERPPTPAAARVRTSCIGKELSGEK